MNEPIHTTCPYCGVGCGLRVITGSETPQIEPDPEHPANLGRICTKGASLSDTVDMQGRLLYPQIRGRRVDWNYALERVAGGFRRAIDQYGPDAVAFYVSGQLLTEDYYVANKLMKGFIGSGNIDTNSRLCMSSAVAGHQRAFGEDLVPCSYTDLELAELIVMAGSNTAWCHPVLFQRIQAARQKNPDVKLVVIDPRRTETAESADLHLPIKPGTDVTLFNGLLAWLAEHDICNGEFMANHTSGFDDALHIARDSAGSLNDVARECDLPPTDVRKFYEWFAQTGKTLSLYSQGVNQSSSGTDKVNAIINCHLATGRIGKPGMGPFSLTGQPNAMGGREVGGLASTLAAHMQFNDPGAVDRVRRFWSSDRVADKPGLKAVDLFDAINQDRIKAIWIMGTNPVVSLPDANAARRALHACELVVVSDCMTHTDTTATADIILPAAAWGEKDGTVTNSERRISRQRPFLSMPGEARPDWWIITEVAGHMGYADAFPYDHPSEIFDEHARLSGFENNGERLFDISGLAGLTREAYDDLQPVQWPVTASFPASTPSGGREGSTLIHSEATPQLLDTLRFPTTDGRAHFISTAPRMPEHRTDEHYPLILNTGRVRDHWHTLTRTGKSPRLSVHTPEPGIAVHPDDAAHYGIADQALAQAETAWGKLIARVNIDANQRRGEIFIPIHWNDQFGAKVRVGALVNPVVDPVSGEPEFKYTPARLKSWPAAWYGFLLTRTESSIGHNEGFEYWLKIRGKNFWRIELAGRESHTNWAMWARRLLGAVKPGADWLEFSDTHGGHYRVAHIDSDDRLTGCLYVAPRPAALPAREWLGSLFEKTRLDYSDRNDLLAGLPPLPKASGDSY